MKVQDRLIKYAKVHTTSDPFCYETPSSQRQFDLAHLLVAELNALGVSDVTIDEHAYVMGRIPSNTNKKNVPAIGFLAHMDTSPDLSGENVNPQTVENYDGGDIKLNDEYTLSPKDFPELKNYVGQTLITTDGTTLLGADDKAGIAEIMTAIEYILAHPGFEHGDICVAFNPDEEIGRGVVKFDVAKFGADFAYTLDGGAIGGVEYENFNAASMDLEVKGRGTHPGSSKNQMVNAQEIILEFHKALPQYEKPEYTTGYEGFYHLHSMSGDVETAHLKYIIRDHSDELFEKKKAYAKKVVEELQVKYPIARFNLDIKNTYLNMRRQIEPNMHIIELAKAAFAKVGITSVVEPIRGGTDGSNLSYMGLPCPNLFTGGHNYHGRFEYIPVESMEKAVEVVLNIINLAVENAE
jgi:peptidase T